MTQLYLVDTSVWIFALRRTPSETIRHRIENLLDLDLVTTCGLIVLELLGGASHQGEYDRLRRRLGGVHRIATREEDWEEAARLAFSLRRAGVTVPFTDILLSTLAMRDGAVLLHADRDFELISRHSPLQSESLADALF